MSGDSEQLDLNPLSGVTEITPKGWCWTMLREIAAISGGVTKNAANTSGTTMPYLRVANVYTNELRLDDISEIKVNDNTLERVLLRRGDLLVVEGNGSLDQIGRVAIWDGSLDPCVHQNHLIKIRLPYRHLPKWSLFWLLSPSGRSAITSSASSTSGLHTLSLSKVGVLPIPIAPERERRQIISILDEWLSKLDAAVAGLRRVQANLKRYRASVLKAAVEGRLVPTEAELARQEGREYEPASVLLERILVERRRRWEEAELAKMKAKGKTPKDDKWKAKYEEPAAPNTGGLGHLPGGWCWSTMAHLGFTSGGLTKNSSRDLHNEQIPYLRVANVYADELKLDEISSMGVSNAEQRRTLLRQDDLLIVEGNGSIDQIGRVALWNGSISPCAHQNHLIKIRAYDTRMARWMLTWMLSPGGRKQIMEAASSTSGLHTLSLSKIDTLPIPVPPKNELARIYDGIEASLLTTSVTTQTIASSYVRCARLRQSILKWAFEGKLVDQDPNDEPASVLLARIRAEREAATTSAKPKPKPTRSPKPRRTKKPPTP